MFMCVCVSISFTTYFDSLAICCRVYFEIDPKVFPDILYLTLQLIPFQFQTRNFTFTSELCLIRTTQCFTIFQGFCYILSYLYADLRFGFIMRSVCLCRQLTLAQNAPDKSRHMHTQ